MDQANKPAMEAPILRLPAEILLEILDYVHDPTALCALISSCRQTYRYVGKDFVHMQCAKDWAEKERMDMEQPLVSTLAAAAGRCFDMDVLTWILDIYMLYFPHCLQRGIFYTEDSTGNMALHAAVRSGNTAAVKLLLERGAEVPRRGDPLHMVGPDGWERHACSLSIALMNKNFSTGGMCRSLLEAGHAANFDHVAQAVEKNDPDLVKAVLARALEPQNLRSGGPIRTGEVPLSKAFRKGRDGDMRVLEVLMAEKLLVLERSCDYFRSDRDVHPRPCREPRVPNTDKKYDEYPDMSFPVGYAVRKKCPQKALFVLRHQVLQEIDSPGLMRCIVHQVCSLYAADQSRPSGKSPQYHTTCINFIKGFHPEFTSRLIDDESCEGSDAEMEEQKWQLGCDQLMYLVLRGMGPSHAVVKHLLANGCRIPAGALDAEIQHWSDSAHCLTCKYKSAHVKLCKKCAESEVFAYQLGKKEHTLRSRVSRLDALLARASPAVLNDSEKSSESPDYDKITPLDYAIILRLWIVAYRLIHHGADFSLLDEEAKASIRELYRDTFPDSSHHLVVDARAGKFVPDTKVFTRGLKGDEEEQALTLVMLTIGLPSGT